MTVAKHIIGVDLFCGVGGMSLGFELAGIDVVFAVDSDPINIASYSLNFPNSHAYLGDLSHLSGNEIRKLSGLGKTEIDVLFGGPPCQGFSVIGRRNSDDSRNFLLFEFARLINELQPKYFVVENVKGLLFEQGKGFLEAFSNCLGENYSIVSPIKFLDASVYGVPQKRERVFILGHRSNLHAPEYPQASSGNSTPSVWEAIGDLPNIDDHNDLIDSHVFRGHLGNPLSKYARHMRGEYDIFEDRELISSNKNGITGCQRTAHTPNVIHRFENTKPGSREPISQYDRLNKDGYCTTLRAGSGKDHGSFMAARPIHPIQPRVITVREAARLHSFPDSFQFHKTKWHSFRQIGNSVPPFLAKAVAEGVKDALLGS